MGAGCCFACNTVKLLNEENAMLKDETDELKEKLKNSKNKATKLNSQCKAEINQHALLKEDMKELERKSKALVDFYDGIKASTDAVFLALNMQDADAVMQSNEGLNKMEMMFFREIGGKLIQESERLQEAQRQGKATGIARNVMITSQYAMLVKDIVKDTVSAWQHKEGKDSAKELDIEEFRNVVWKRIFSDLQEMFAVLQDKIEEKARNMTDMALSPGV